MPLPKLSRSTSALISQILCIAAFAAMCVLAVTLPVVLRSLLTVFEKPDYLYTPTLIILYISAIPAFTADISLFLLLRQCKIGAVFNGRSVALIRLISWCCFAEAVMFVGLAFYYLVGVLMAFVFLFMGLIVRVVKNVIEEAVFLKEENDLMI